MEENCLHNCKNKGAEVAPNLQNWNALTWNFTVFIKNLVSFFDPKMCN